jgi:hypothetical protein
MKVQASGLAARGKQFPDVVHMRAGLVDRRQLLQGNQRRRQRFRDHPFVVAGNSLFGHLCSNHRLLV